jgi:cytohesin
MQFDEHIAATACRGDLNSLKEMLSRGVDPNEADEEGFTALHQAIQNGTSEVVRVLLDAGADPNGEDARGWTPLYRAVEAENDARSQGYRADTSVVELLLSHGADPNRASSKPGHPRAYERTPLQLARGVGNEVLTRMLVEAGATD